MRSNRLLAVAWLLLAGPCLGWVIAASDEGWVIERLQTRLAIQADGSIAANEALDVDFRGLSRHGIFRDIVYRLGYDDTRYREYGIDLGSVTRADGSRHQVQTLTEDGLWRFKIGDPNHTISGKETYRIAYRLTGALNGFADHDELYWNATGTWPARMLAATIVVTAPGGAINRVDCFQGASGARDHCRATFTPGEATFTATRPLAAGEQMTIVAGLRKGALPDPQPHLVNKPRPVTRFFDLTPATEGFALAELAAIVVGLGALWWRVGRDRQFVALQPTSPDAADERVPMFGGRPVAVEFQPPDRIRPGQMGLLADERADTLDVTATIVDLAVRGYLKITELPKEHWFTRQDWQLDKLKEADAGLLDYERIVLNGLFDSKQSRKLSDLKTKFYDDLAKAKTSLYQDALKRGWFPRSPRSVRALSRLGGILATIGGVVLSIFLGVRSGAGLLGLPVIAGGALLTFMAGAMPRRTAKGRDMLQRTLGFARYIKTAEVHQQDFAERANIFTEYLPYAIVFKCVERWARAFKDIDLQAATAGWYSGTTGFNIGTFSSSLGAFSSAVSTTITSTPGGSGSSGFGGGGSSGGGGGGGGGGSW